MTLPWPRSTRTGTFSLGVTQFACCLVLALSLPAMAGDEASESTAAESRPSLQPRVLQFHGKLPLAFEPNQGQTDGQVKFLSRGRGFTLFLTGNEAVLSLGRPSAVSGQPSANGNSKRETGNGESDNRNSTALNGLLRRPADHGPRRAGTPDRAPLSMGNLQSSIINSPAPRAQPPAPAVLRLKLAGANAPARVVGLDELAGKSNYFLGNDPKQWRTKVPNFGKVKYEGVYPGIDLVYYGKESGGKEEGRRSGRAELEFDFVVAPGADPRAIRFEVGEGFALPRAAGGRPYIDADGDLVIATGGGEIRFRKPVVYQPGAPLSSPANASAMRTSPLQPTAGAVNPQSSLSHRQFVDGRYVLRATRLEGAASAVANHQSPITNHQYEVAFELGPYDKTQPLIIDPVLAYSTYLGGSSIDYGFAITVDSSEGAYVTGQTSSSDFPHDSGSLSGGADVFVAKLSADGSALDYSTYIGGTGTDAGFGIAVDGSGNAYVTGYTSSSGFPTTTGTTAALQASIGGGTDAFFLKLDSSGSTLLYSTFLGGSGTDYAWDVALDESNTAYIRGSSRSTNAFFSPITAGDTTCGSCSSGLPDAFLAKIDPTQAGAASFLYFTFLGGSGSEVEFDGGVAVDGAGIAYLSGTTNSTNLPTTSGAYQTAIGGAQDAFIGKIDPTVSGSASLLYLTYLGGSTGVEEGTDIAVDGAANVYVTGRTTASGFPVLNAYQSTLAGTGGDVFLSKLDLSQSGSAALLYSTFLGGSTLDRAKSITVDSSSGQVSLTGETFSSDFPTLNPIQDTFGGPSGSSDAFVAQLDPSLSGSASLLFSTYFGGSNADTGYGIAVDTSGDVYITGRTFATDLPTTSGAFDTTCGSDGACNGSFYDGFVAKISPATPGPVVSLAPTSLDFGDWEVTEPPTTSTVKTVTLSNVGDANMTFTGSFAFNIGSHPTLPGSADFAENNDCADLFPLAPGDSCTINVLFTPTALGNEGAILTVTDEVGSAHNVTLTGRGVSSGQVFFSSLPPFGNQRVGTTSAPQTVTLTNTSTSGPLGIISIVVSGNFALVPSGDPCGASLASEDSCDIDIVFTPQSPGTNTGTLTISHDGADSPSSVDLEGTGTVTTLNPYVAFTPKIDHTAGAGAYFGATADLDNDGDRDLVVVNASSDSLSVFLGNGDGTFPAPLTVAVGDNPLQVAIGDFDADGKPDLAVVNFFDNNVSILLGNGNGTFASPVNHSVGTNPTALAVADFDQDGKLDLAVANNISSDVSILLGDGTGGFATAVNYAVGTNPNASVVAGYFDGDDNLDLAVATNLGGVSVLLGVGGGTFGTAASFSAGTNPFALGVADFDGDGNFDLVATNSGSGNVSVLRGNGDGTFQSPANTTIGSSPRGVAVADLNGDGRIDMAVSKSGAGSVSVVVGNGDGTFLTAVSFAVGNNPQGLALGDFNGDGMPDLAVPNQTDGTVSILLNTAALFSTYNLTFGNQVVGSTSEDQSITLRNASNSVDLNVGGFTPSGDFSDTTQTCTISPLPPGGSCTVNVNFSPTGFGLRSGTLSVSTDAVGSPHDIHLTGTGTGTPAIEFSPTSVNFPGNPVNASFDCITKDVTLENTGDAALTIETITVLDTPLFVVTSDCPVGGSLAAGASCLVHVNFDPVEVGTFDGTLTVSSNAPDSPHTVALSGTGTPACSLLAAVRSATLLRGSESADFSIQDAKPSCSPVNLNLSCSVENPAACALHPTVIAPSGASTLRVTNLRRVAAESLVVRVKSQSEFRAASELITVRFADFAFTRAPESATVAAGETATYALAIRPINGLSGPLSLACSGAPRGATCRVEPASVTLDGASLAQVKVRVTTAGRAAAGPGGTILRPIGNVGAHGHAPWLGLWVVALLAVAAASRRRGIAPVRTPALQRVVVAAALLALLLAASCGGGGTWINSNSGGTPAGTYTLTITGTYTNSTGSSPSSLTNGTTVTLRVN